MQGSNTPEHRGNPTHLTHLNAFPSDPFHAYKGTEGRGISEGEGKEGQKVHTVVTGKGKEERGKSQS